MNIGQQLTLTKRHIEWQFTEANYGCYKNPRTNQVVGYGRCIIAYLDYLLDPEPSVTLVKVHHAQSKDVVCYTVRFKSGYTDIVEAKDAKAI